MPQPNDDLSGSLVGFDQDSSLCAAIELSLDKWQLEPWFRVWHAIR